MVYTSKFSKFNTIFNNVTTNQGIVQINNNSFKDISDNGQTLELPRTEDNSHTYHIYQLTENIIFDPTTIVGDSLYDTPTIDPTILENKKKTNWAYVLGWFAAISIQNYDGNPDDIDELDNSYGIILDLNGYTIKQSTNHNLLQRFFSCIELGSAPFVCSQGPHKFNKPTNSTHTCPNASQASLIKCAKNVFIGNYQLSNSENNHGSEEYHFGLSSHYSFHGNQCDNIYLENLKCKEYEVAAISVNKPSNFYIDNCQIEGHHQDIALRGLFSTAMFIRPYIEIIKDLTTISIEDGNLTPAIIRNDLRNAIDAVYHAIKTGNKTQNLKNLGTSSYLYKLFANRIITYNGEEMTLQDGIAYYGILFGNKGVQVNGIHNTFQNYGTNINITNTDIKNVKGNPIEALNIVDADSSIKLVDPIGSSLQLFYNYKVNSETFEYLSIYNPNEPNLSENGLPQNIIKTYQNKSNIDKENYLNGMKLYYQTKTYTYESFTLNNEYNYVFAAQCIVLKYLQNTSLYSSSNLISDNKQQLCTVNSFLSSSLLTTFLNWLNNNNNFYSLLGTDSLNDYKLKNISFNVDQMHHVGKGAMALRLGSLQNVNISNINIECVYNYGDMGSDINGKLYFYDNGIGVLGVYNDTTISQSPQNIEGYNGGVVRGISIESCDTVNINNSNSNNQNIITKLVSLYSKVYGVELLFQSKNIMMNNYTLSHFYVTGTESFYFDSLNNISFPGGNTSLTLLDYANNPTSEPYVFCIKDNSYFSHLNIFNKNDNVQEEFYNYINESGIHWFLNNCFLKNTMIMTDKGPKKIQDITTNDTINHIKIKKIINGINSDSHMIKIDKNAFGNNIPNNDTYISINHKIVYYGKLIKAKHFVTPLNKKIKFVNLGQKEIYNLQLEHKIPMCANNLNVETND